MSKHPIIPGLKTALALYVAPFLKEVATILSVTTMNHVAD